MMTWLRQSLSIVENSPSTGGPDSEVLKIREAKQDQALELPNTHSAIGTSAADLAIVLTAREWERIKGSDDVRSLLRFAAYFTGYYSELAYERVLLLQNQQREDANWLWAEQESTASAYLRYLAAWPHGRYVRTAQSCLVRLGFPSANFVPARQIRENNQSVTAALNSGANQPTEVTAARSEFSGGRTTRGLAFRDAQLTPELVAVPTGSFMMGADDDSGRVFERPVRPVSIAHRIAVGRFPVMFEEWGHAIRAGAISYQPSDEGWGRDRRPVINVSWHEAKLYTGWLSQVTGFEYRLLTEAEWEYCCRAGSRDAYAIGAHITPDDARFSANEWGSAGRTCDVGSFEANQLGIYDMHGNVSEWVEDDWVPSYGADGNDGSAVKSNTSTQKITRGGGWPDLPGALRSACRNPLSPKIRNNSTGFRVARTFLATPR